VKLPGRPWLLVLVPLVAVLVGWGWWRAVVAERETRRELVELRVRRQQLEEVNRALARQVEALKHEREARARAAREALDVAAPGEMLVVIPSPTPTSGAK
jgi:cell division protein FtsB